MQYTLQCVFIKIKRGHQSERENVWKMIAMSHLWSAQTGLATSRYRGMYWLFHYKRHYCHYHEWKIGCTWKVHVQWEDLAMETLQSSKAFCLTLSTNA